MINKANFFTSIRSSLFGGKLLFAQVAGIEAVLKEWEERGLQDERQLAYILATVYHETARTMQPIEEYGKGKNRTYGHKVKYSGKPYNNVDNVFYGRGLTQNTWYEIYEKLTIAAKKQGYDWDFIQHPELLLLMEPSVWATFHAMYTGLYTGKKIQNYFSGKIEDWKNARRVINGLDCWEDIAIYAKKFYNAIKES